MPNCYGLSEKCGAYLLSPLVSRRSGLTASQFFNAIVTNIEHGILSILDQDRSQAPLLLDDMNTLDVKLQSFKKTLVLACQYKPSEESACISSETADATSRYTLQQCSTEVQPVTGVLPLQGNATLPILCLGRARWLDPLLSFVTVRSLKILECDREQQTALQTKIQYISLLYRLSYLSRNLMAGLATSQTRSTSKADSAAVFECIELGL